MASNAKDTLIRRIAGTPGKGTGANTGLGTTDIVVPPFPLLPDRLTKETAAQFREEVDRWRAGLQAQFPVPQTVTTTTGAAGTVTANASHGDYVTKSQLDDAIYSITGQVQNIVNQIQNNSTSTSITPRTFQIFGKATSNAVVYDGKSNVEFNVRTLSVVPADIALSTGSFIVGSVGEVGVDTQKSDIPLSGFGPAAYDVSLGGYKISNLATPTSAQDAANKDYVDSRPPVNIYNTSGTLTGNRTITGSGYSLSITGTSSVSLVSNTSTLLASPTVTFSTGGALNLYIASSTAAGTTSDFILGVNPSDGQIRYTSTTISSLSNQGTSGLVSGSTGKIAKFTGPNSVGDSIMTQSASMAVVEVAGAMSVTDSYQLNGQYIISWNAPYNNAFFGTRPAGWNTVTGYSNTGVGKETLYSITSGQNNSGFGSQALRSNQNGNYNTAVGSAALQYTVSGSDNTAVGALSCIQTTSTDNTGVGSRTLVANTTGAANFAGGSLSLYSCSTGSFNVSIGYKAGYFSTQGSYNTIVGARALESITGASSSSNVAIGFNAGNNMTAGSGNIIIGTAAQVPDPVGSYQLSIGNLIFGTGLDAINSYVSSGNIGIGIKVPTAKLDVDGAIRGLYQRYGSGSPEGLVAAPVGARYSRTDGGAGTSLYVKESGGTTTLGWVAMKTADGISTANIYNSDGTLSSNRTLSGGGFNLTFSGIAALGLTSTASTTLTSPTVRFATGGALNLYLASTTASGSTSDYILGVDPASGQIRYTTSTVAGLTTTPVNIYNSNGTLTGNRTLTGGGFSLSITGASTIGLTSTTSTTISSPTVTFATGAAKDLFLSSTTSAGSTSDYILGIDPATGQIRYTTSTVAGIVAGSGSGTVSGTTGRIAKFTSATSVGDSIVTENTSTSVISVAGSVSVTNGYQINGAYIISFNSVSGNSVFGTRPVGWDSVTGSANTGSGFGSLYSLTSGSRNTAYGYNAVNAITSGLDCVGIGWYALYRNSTGTQNTAVGSGALSNCSNAANNTAVGYYAADSTTTAGFNTAIGNQALRFNTTGDSNFAGGSESLYNCSTGSENSAVGRTSLNYVTSGSRNTAVGTGSLGIITTANNNVALGWHAGNLQSAGSGNIIIGYTSQAADLTGSNQLSIGNLIYGTGLDGTSNTPSSGNIGIGVQVPSCKLDVDGAVKSTYQRFGINTPEGLVAAPVGALYSRTDGSSGTTLYVKETGAGTSSGWVAIKTATGLTSANIYNSDGTLTANRTLLGNNACSLTMSGLTSLSLSASGSIGVTSSSDATITAPVANISAATSSKITSPTVTFDTGAAKNLYLSSTTANGTYDDYILGINPADGQIRYSSKTIRDISASNVIVVNTVADLANVNPSIYTNAITLGYWSPLDGGHSSYRWVSSQTDTNSGSKIKSNISGSWLNKSDVVNVNQWGATVNAPIASTAARINEAIDWAGSVTSPPRVLIPEGIYLLEATIVIRKSNIHIDLYGTLKNRSGIPYGVIYIGGADATAMLNNKVQSTAPTYSSTGQVTAYSIKNVTIDGHGIGVIDGNCQTVPFWESNKLGATWISTNERYGSYHGVTAYGVSGLILMNLTVQNAVAWAVAIDVCESFDVGFVRAYAGFANGRMDMGVPQFLGTQDGIHANDSKNGFIHDCVVESGDDALAVSATRTTDAANVVVSGNKAMVKTFTYNADGSVNTTSVAGRYGLSCFILAQQYYCDLKNVTFSNNVISGGHGLFFVEDANNTAYPSVTSHSGVPTNIKFIGNLFSGQNSSGTSSTMRAGWGINGVTNVELIGNTFDNIARVGRIGGSSGKNGTVVFRDNKFTNFKRGYPYDAFPQDTSAIIWMTEGTKLVVEGNTFENNDIIPVLVGSFGTLDTSLFSDVIVNNNVFINNNLRWTSATPQTDLSYSSILNVNSADYIEFNGNTIVNNYGNAFCGRSIKALTAKNNRIKGLGNGAYTIDADAFYVNGNNDVTSIYTDIQNNNVSDIDGRFLTAFCPGQMYIQNNIVNNAGRYRNQDYLIWVQVRGSSLSAAPYTSFGGYISGNTAYRSSAQGIMYFNSTIPTTGFTGNKLFYSPSLNHWGSNYTAVVPEANGASLINIY